MNEWEDIQEKLMTQFPVEDVEPAITENKRTKTRRLTGEIHAKWLFGLTKKTSSDAAICEIGTLYGFLTAAIGLACIGTDRRIVAIDHMIGSHCMDMANRPKCIYRDFIDNMIAIGVWDKIIPFPMKSHSPLDLSIYEKDKEVPVGVRDSQYLQASDMLLLMDAEFELIYIDGFHSYENVLQELKLYSRFLKPGGTICGDDCNAYGKPFLQSFLNDKDSFEQLPARAVAMAMLEFFNNNDEFEPIDVPSNQFGFMKK